MFFTALKKSRKNSQKADITGSPDHLMLALEPRLLFDAAGLVAGLDFLPDPNAPDPNPDPPGPKPENLGPDLDIPFFADPVPLAVDTPTNLVFIDAGVIDYENLVADIPGKVVRLSAQSDGIGQIRDILSQYQGIKTIHIISHGTSGSITLGDAILSNDTLDTHALSLQQWGDSFAPGADILIYGCNVAKGTQGQSFVAQLSDITGADVAASDDITGAAAKGGDWELETRTGIIESGLAVSLQAQSWYTHTLAEITVNEAGDKKAEAGLNLREAILEAETNGITDDTIIFNLDPADTTIQLEQGVLQINSAEGVTINGDSDITLYGNYTSQIFSIGYGASASLTGLYITGGKGNKGGGIYNEGTLMVSNSALYDNIADYGGGIWNSKTATLNDCYIAGNYAYNDGGGIHNSATATATVENSKFIYNSADNSGGVIHNGGTATFKNSYFIYNSADNSGGVIHNSATATVTFENNYSYYNFAQYGGAIWNNGITSLKNSVVAYNLAFNDSGGDGDGAGIWNSGTTSIENSFIGYNYTKADGGGIYNQGDLTITNSTISTNKSLNSGGGIYNSNGTLKLYHSTISGNIGAAGSGIFDNGTGQTNIGHTIVTDQISGTITSQGYNLFAQASVTGAVLNDLLSANADLQPLDDNGGPTPTHALGNNSDALNAGNSAVTAGAGGISLNDQRGTGYNRVVNTIDIGAVEMSSIPPTPNPPDVNINHVPTAIEDNFTTDEDTAITTGNVLSNDMDQDGDTLTITGMDTSATKGNVTNNGDGTFYYDPHGKFDYLPPGTTAVDSFVYTISDGKGGTDNTTVSITITGLNEHPTGNDDNYSTNEETPITTANVLINDMDSDGDILTMTGVDTTGTKGNVTNNGNGTFDYDPNGQFEYLGVGKTAIDTFTYTVSDGNEGADTAKVTIAITGVNDAPIAHADNFTTNEEATITTGNVLSNDMDPDGDTLAIITGMDTSTTKGSVTNNGNDTFDYDPNGQFEYLGIGATAVDIFTYTVSDGKGGTDTTTVTITITGVNDAPLARDDTGFTTRYDTTLRITANGVLANDTDPDKGDICCITACDTVSKNGAQVSLSLDEGFDYDPTTLGNQTPGEGQILGDTFSYTVSDGNGGTDTVTVAVSVTGPPPNPPLGNGKGNSQYLLTPNGSDDDWIAGNGQKDVFFTSSGRSLSGLFSKGHSNPLGQGGVSDPFFIPLPPEQDGTNGEAPDAPPDSGEDPNTGDSNTNSADPSTPSTSNENTSAPPVSQGFNEQLQIEANRFETQRIHLLGLLAEKKALV